MELGMGTSGNSSVVWRAMILGNGSHLSSSGV